MENNGKWVKITNVYTLKVGDIVKYCSIESNGMEYWCGGGGAAGTRIVSFIGKTQINISEPGNNSLMSNLAADEWDKIYKWVPGKETQKENTPKTSSDKVATIYGQEVDDKYQWSIEFPVRIGHVFLSDKFYNQRSDAIRAAKRICEQMNIPYKVSKD